MRRIKNGTCLGSVWDAFLGDTLQLSSPNESYWETGTRSRGKWRAQNPAPALTCIHTGSKRGCPRALCGVAIVRGEGVWQMTSVTFYPRSYWLWVVFHPISDMGEQWGPLLFTISVLVSSLHSLMSNPQTLSWGLKSPVRTILPIKPKRLV